MLLINRIVLLTVLFGLLSACSEPAPTVSQEELEKLKEVKLEPYSKTEWLDIYFEQLSIGEAYDTVFFVPLNTCEECVNYTLNSLVLNHYSDLLIIGGIESEYPLYQERLATIVDKSTAFRDSSYQMFAYDINVFGPTLIIKGEKESSFINIDSKNIAEVLKIIQWKDPGS